MVSPSNNICGLSQGYGLFGQTNCQGGNDIGMETKKHCYSQGVRG